MVVTINGETKDVPAGLTVAGLLAHMGLAGRPVAVEVNRELVAKRQHELVHIQAGDAIECATFVQGG